MTELSKPKPTIDSLKRRIKSSWILAIQVELIRRDENAMLVTVENADTFKGLTPQQAADAAIKLYPNQGSSALSVPKE